VFGGTPRAENDGAVAIVQPLKMTALAPMGVVPMATRLMLTVSRCCV
jgi:hypothetical protein